MFSYLKCYQVEGWQFLWVYIDFYFIDYLFRREFFVSFPSRFITCWLYFDIWAHIIWYDIKIFPKISALACFALFFLSEQLGINNFIVTGYVVQFTFKPSLLAPFFIYYRGNGFWPWFAYDGKLFTTDNHNNHSLKNTLQYIKCFKLFTIPRFQLK